MKQKYFTEEERKEANRKQSRERSRKNYKQNRENQEKVEEGRAYNREYYHNVVKKDLVLYLWVKAKGRAKRGGLEFSMGVEDIHIPDICPILEIPLFPSKGNPTANSPSLDRIDNSKGYTKSNIRVISYKANRIKGNLTLRQIENLYNYCAETLLEENHGIHP